MNMLANLKTQSDIQEKDTLGKGSYLLDSGVYDATIKYAYLKPTAKGGLSICVGYTTDGSEHSETFYVMNDKGQNYYEFNGKKSYYKGFSVVNDLSLFTTQKELSQLSTDKKVIEVYDYETQKNKPTEVDMIVGMIGKPVKLAVLKQQEPKKTNNNGTWIETDETKETNVISKVFHPTKELTVAEVKSGVTEPTFINKWKEEWDGKVNVIGAKTNSNTTNSTKSVAPKTSSLFS